MLMHLSGSCLVSRSSRFVSYSVGMLQAAFPYRCPKPDDQAYIPNPFPFTDSPNRTLSQKLPPDQHPCHITTSSSTRYSLPIMIASAVRLSAALGRQPGLVAVTSTATSAGLKTSATSPLQATTTLRNLDGRLWSKNR